MSRVPKTISVGPKMLSSTEEFKYSTPLSHKQKGSQEITFPTRKKKKKHCTVCLIISLFTKHIHRTVLSFTAFFVHTWFVTENRRRREVEGGEVLLLALCYRSKRKLRRQCHNTLTDAKTATQDWLRTELDILFYNL